MISAFVGGYPLFTLKSYEIKLSLLTIADFPKKILSRFIFQVFILRRDFAQKVIQYVL